MSLGNIYITDINYIKSISWTKKTEREESNVLVSSNVCEAKNKKIIIS